MHHNLSRFVSVTTALFLALVMLSPPITSAQPADAPRYALGSIPDQTVWSGSTRWFLVHDQETVGATFTLEASPQPSGALSVEFGPQIVFLHLRDQHNNGRWSEALGTGDTDWRAIAEVLREIRFQGDVII